MDSYNSFFFLILGILAVSRPSESQLGRVPPIPRWGTGSVEIGSVKSSPGEPIVEPLRNTVKEKLSSSNNKNEGISEIDPIHEPSTSNAFSHSDPSETAEVVNHYGGRVPDRNADLEKSAFIGKSDQSILKKSWNRQSELREKEVTKKTSEPIEIHYRKEKRRLTLYDSAGKPVPCISKTTITKDGRERSFHLEKRVEEEYLSRGVRTVVLYQRPGQQGRKKTFHPLKKLNEHPGNLKGDMKYLNSKTEPIAEKDQDDGLPLEFDDNSSVGNLSNNPIEYGASESKDNSKRDMTGAGISQGEKKPDRIFISAYAKV